MKIVDKIIEGNEGNEGNERNERNESKGDTTNSAVKGYATITEVYRCDCGFIQIVVSNPFFTMYRRCHVCDTIMKQVLSKKRKGGGRKKD